MRNPFNILVAGVGGQGNLVCGRVLADAAIRSGLRPIIGDTFGASRRGGSVLTHLRIGTTDWGPLIPKGEVDILLGLEPLEALRAATKFAGDRTVAIVSQTKIPTVASNGESGKYPAIDRIIESLKKRCKQVIVLNAEEILSQIGSMKMLNAYILGALGSVTQFPISQDIIRVSLEFLFGPKSTNLVAFDEGTKAVS